jgi:hypothetical protein
MREEKLMDRLLPPTATCVRNWINCYISGAPGAMRLTAVRLPSDTIQHLQMELGAVPKGHVITLYGAPISPLLEIGPRVPRWVCGESLRTFRRLSHPASCGVRHLGSCDWRGPFAE